MILVIGATGTIGSELVPQLLEAGKRVRAFVRDKHKVAEKRVEIAVGRLAATAYSRSSSRGCGKGVPRCP
jgi:uncharacterized protein YbjT (DUF2867 family)